MIQAPSQSALERQRDWIPGAQLATREPRVSEKPHLRNQGGRLLKSTALKTGF